MSARGATHRIARLLALAGLALSVASTPAGAQVEAGTVFVDDSTAAQSTLRALPSLLRAGNEAEAVRVLQASLDSGAERLVPVEGDPNLFVSVRDAVHRQMLAEPELLERYRLEYDARAKRMLEQGRYDEVESNYLLTAAGYQAALSVARERFGLARFHSAARVLLQLEDHPERAGDSSAADLLSLTAAQLDNPELRARAQRWLEEANLPAPDWDALRIPKPPAVSRTDVSPLMGGQLPPMLPQEEPWSQAIDRDLAPGPDETLPDPPPVETDGGAFWLFPAVAGDTILINDGITLSAWDRFSLRLRWRTSMLTDQAAILDFAQTRREPQIWRSIEMPSMVAVDARAAYASMGLHMASAPDFEPAIVAVDLGSGHRLWATDPREIDARYAYANVRGGPIIGEGRAIFTLREDNRAGRQVATALVGLDTLTGQPAWVRTLGSAGTGWSRSTRTVGSGGVVEGGVVYWYEPMGIVAAYDAHDGRPIWLRRFDTANHRGRDERGGAWNMRPPVIAGDNVLALVDQLEMVYRLDRKTGALLGKVTTVALGDAKYLVGVNDRVAAVGQSSVWFFGPEAVDDDMRSREGFARAQGFDALITGRAMAAGDTLLVPSGAAAVLLDPATGRQAGPMRALPRPGTVAPLSDQLVVVDTGVLQSVMSADVAAMALTDRLRDNPDDIASLVSLVLLAERRNVLEAVPAAARRALEALAIAGEDSEDALRTAQAEARRLFEALLSMTHRMVGLDADQRDNSLANELAELALSAAPGMSARARALLTVGELRDRQGRGADAAGAYLDVLADDALRTVELGEDFTAGIAATRRLQKLMPLHGYAIIEPHEARAAAALAQAAPDPAGDVQRLAVAARVPVSLAAMSAYVQVAQNAQQRGQGERAARAWRRALDIARLVRTSDGPVSGDDVAMIGASLARVLADEDHLAAAARTVRQLRPVSPIEQVEAPTIEELADRFAQRDRGSKLGARPVAVSQRLDGWRLINPISTIVDATVPEHVVLGAGHLVGIWALAPELGPIEGEPFEADPKGPLELVWTATHDPATPPTLLRQDRHRALFAWQRDGNTELRSVSLFDNSSWTSGPLVQLFDAELREQRLGEEGPHVAALMANGGQANPGGWVVASNREHIVLTRRDGLLAILDANTGNKLYSGRPGIGTVMDVAVAGGRVWVMGSADAPGAPTAGSLETLAIWAFSTEGDTLVQRVGVNEPPRWIAAVEDGSAIIGTHSSVYRLSASEADPRGAQIWESLDDAALNAALGWVLGDTLVVMSSRGDLALASVDDGRFGGRPLMLSIGDGEVPRLSRRGERIVVMTSGGVTVLDASGDVLGRDALRSAAGRADEKVRPALAEDRVLLVPRRSFSIANGQGEYIVSTVDTTSAKVTGTRSVLLPEPPLSVNVIDGYGLISTAQRTVVLRFE